MLSNSCFDHKKREGGERKEKKVKEKSQEKIK